MRESRRAQLARSASVREEQTGAKSVADGTGGRGGVKARKRGIFLHGAPEDIAQIPRGVVGRLILRTSGEIEAERIARKVADAADKLPLL
jgi:hypothetical protein